MNVSDVTANQTKLKFYSYVPQSFSCAIAFGEEGRKVEILKTGAMTNSVNIWFCRIEKQFVCHLEEKEKNGQNTQDNDKLCECLDL